ncbi:MAG: acylphosphatase [Actinomycetota bacterium]|nr:acylphosphatase [Actinomycetota bacterium]
MTVRKRALVSGRVQGVFYRDTCRRVASERDVAGSAENLAGGAVEVILEGEPEAVDDVLAWCRTGTSGSHVQNVEVTDETPQGLRGFRVL